MAKGKYHEWLEEDNLLLLTKWAREGYSNRDICKMISINETTLIDWMHRFPQIDKAIKTGRAPVIVKIETAFYSRCDWQQVEESKTETTTDYLGRVTIKETVSKRWVPPDTAAMIFALKNLAPDRFRDKQKDIVVEEQVDDGLINALTASGTKLLPTDDSDVLPTQDGGDE